MSQNPRGKTCWWAESGASLRWLKGSIIAAWAAGVCLNQAGSCIWISRRDSAALLLKVRNWQQLGLLFWGTQLRDRNVFANCVCQCPRKSDICLQQDTKLSLCFNETKFKTIIIYLQSRGKDESVPSTDWHKYLKAAVKSLYLCPLLKPVWAKLVFISY